ncbi:MAG: hypothetical protein ACM3SW_09560 [Actinomycetota bacterium]
MTNGWAQHRGVPKRTPPVVMTMRSEAVGTLSVSLTSAPDGVPLSGTSSQRTLSFGTVSYNMASAGPNVRVIRRASGFAVATRFGLTLQDPSAHVASATVMASMAAPEAHFSFRLDGIPLETTPQIIWSQEKVGVTSQHLLEIEIPNSITESDSHLQNAILIQVIAN